MPYPLPLTSIPYCKSLGVGNSTAFRAEVPLFFVFPPYMVNESKDLWHQQKVNNLAPLLREQQASKLSFIALLMRIMYWEEWAKC